MGSDCATHGDNPTGLEPLDGQGAVTKAPLKETITLVFPGIRELSHAQLRSSPIQEEAVQEIEGSEISFAPARPGPSSHPGSVSGGRLLNHPGKGGELLPAVPGVSATTSTER